jgi:hypothetical protein
MKETSGEHISSSILLIACSLTKKQEEQQKTYAQFIPFKRCGVVSATPIEDCQRYSSTTWREYRYNAAFKAVRRHVSCQPHWLISLSNAGGTILSSTYGLNVHPKNDPFMESAEKANEALMNVPYPGAYLVDHLPILKHVPGWLPGAKFKRDANEWRKLTLDSINKPFDALKADMVG